MAFRLALVGAGRMGATHARALAGWGEVEVVAAVEPSEAAFARAGLGVPRLRDLAELLASSAGFDGALVSVPTWLHAEVVPPLLAAGVPVLCEKPGGRTSAETRQLARRAEEAGAHLQVAYWRRFVPALRTLRQRIAAGELGTISYVACFQWDERPPPAAFREPASSGGIVLDMGVHELDQIRWLTGQEIEQAACVASSVCSEAPVPGDPESASLVLRLSGGATAHVSLGRRHPPGEVCRVEAIGTAGAERVEFVAPPDGDEVIRAALRAQAADFAAAARGGPSAGATLADAVAAAEAAERAAG